VSCLKCDRWPRSNLERAVRPRSALLVETDFTGCATGRWVAGRPPLACSPTGALWALRHYGRERACSGRGAGRSTGRRRIACQRRN